MERNIFETAANEYNKSSKNQKAQEKAPQKTKPSKKNIDAEFGSHDPETLTMLDQMRKMRLQLKNQLNDMYDLGKKYHINVDNLIQMSSNMHPKEVEEAFKQTEQFENQIKKAMKPNSGFVKSTAKKSTQDLEKERKGKTLGARKKNWISVR